jgi:MFS family permease
MLICRSFGYDEYQSLLLQLPGCAVAFISVWLATWWAGRYNTRGIAIIALVIPTLIGGALMAWLPAGNKGGLLTGNFLTNTVGSSELATPKLTPIKLTCVALPLLYSWITANCKSEVHRRNYHLI